MISAKEYVSQKAKLMADYEKAVREWLRNKGGIGAEIADKIPFLCDGVATPEHWFSSGNDFRPLFILKEASIGINNVSELDSFLEKWGGITRFEHVEDPFGDIKIGSFTSPWGRVLKLTKGLEVMRLRNEHYGYYEDDFGFKCGGEENPNKITGNSKYDYRTANQNYLSTVDKIAVINIKKIAGGTSASSDLSTATQYYTRHLEAPLGELLLKQIELIDPTIIVFCSPEISRAFNGQFRTRLEEKYVCLDGYHPTRNSIARFYDYPINQYEEIQKMK